MKKLAILLTICLTLSLFSGCGKTREPEETIPAPEIPLAQGTPKEIVTDDFKEYSLENGITFYGPQGLKESEIDGMAAYLKNTYFVVMVIEEPRQGTKLQDVTLEEYAAMLAAANDLEPFVRDLYGNLATTNMALSYEESNTFFYYVTVHEAMGSFWLVQVACVDELAGENIEDMACWSASFSWDPAESAA